MYARTITQRIIELQAKGFTLNETKDYLDKEYGINIHINTIWNHRKSPAGQEIIDELIRQQERAILKADVEDRALAMKYRNELLKILLPQRIEAKGEITQTQRVLHLHLWKPEQVAEP